MKKIITSLLIYALCLLSHLSADDIRDAKGRTTLMQVVIDFEVKFNQMKEDEKRLWHVCYEYTNILDGYITFDLDSKTSYSKPIYKREVRRRVSCLDRDIEAHRKCEQDLRIIVEDTIKKIRHIVEVDRVAVAGLDNNAYSALNYCYSPEIYKELRRCGVPFQLKVWTYFNPYLALSSSVIIAAGLTKGYYCCNFSKTIN